LNYFIKRRFIIEVYDEESLEKTILHSLLLSHGIRVDTTTIIVHGHTMYVFDGYLLKHLYPQKSSLEGFVKSVFRRARFPLGVSIYPASILTWFLMDSELLILNQYPYITSNRFSLKPLRSIAVLWGISLVNMVGDKDIFIVRENDLDKYIVKTHYLIDSIYGGWVRRYGENQYREPVVYKHL